MSVGIANWECKLILRIGGCANVALYPLFFVVQKCAFYE